MLSALAFFTLVAYVDATQSGNVPQCPPGCSCKLTFFDTKLYVKCGYVSQDIKEKQLSHQLDSMLSADHFVENLTSLIITNTPLTRVPASVCKLLNLTSLNLDHNKITELPDNCFTKLTKLVTLSAANNAITGLQDGLFDGLQSLVNLVLLSNHISFIGLRLFSNSSDLTSLRLINLDSNRLMSLEPWWYYRCTLGNETSPVKISLSRNSISNFSNELHFQYRCGMKPPYGELILSKNRIRHIMDLFSGWNIDLDSLNTTLSCLSNIRGKRRYMTFDFGGKTYICDCTDFPFYEFASKFPENSILRDVRCGAGKFKSDLGEGFHATSIPIRKFTCEFRDRCPANCRCVYRPANMTVHVHCNSTNMSSLPQDLPPLPKSHVTYKLDFSNNKLLRHLEHRPYFANTSILDLSNCSLTEINIEVLKDVSRFSMVSFRGNMIESFPRQADTVNISATLRIGDNPWRCSCDNSWMIGWLQFLFHQISDPGDIVCASPSRVYGRNVLKSSKDDFCVDPVERILTIILSPISALAAVIILLAATGIVVYKLRVKFYKKWKFHPFDRDECVGEDKDYDVFLCCSSLDDDPHGLRLLEEMESNGYRVYYHERDFLPGQRITDNMARGIERSKRIVCLLTNNFVTR